MSAHTPGPWSVGAGGCIRSDAPETGRQYARGVGYPQIALVTGLHEERPEGERDANARLIAAAPELLAVLEHVRDASDENEDVDLERIEAALAKARGAK